MVKLKNCTWPPGFQEVIGHKVFPGMFVCHIYIFQPVGIYPHMALKKPLQQLYRNSCHILSFHRHYTGCRHECHLYTAEFLAVFKQYIISSPKKCQVGDSIDMTRICQTGVRIKFLFSFSSTVVFLFFLFSNTDISQAIVPIPEVHA